MHSGLEWVGAVVVCLLALAVLLVAALFAYECVERRLQVRRDMIASLAVRRFCDTLHANSYWFGEDPATANMLRAFSRADVVPDVGRIREQWRSERSTQ